MATPATPDRERRTASREPKPKQPDTGATRESKTFVLVLTLILILGMAAFGGLIYMVTSGA